MYLLPRLVLVGNDTSLSVIETDFIPPTAQGVSIIAANVVLVILTAIWTALRFWCRKLKGTGYFAEDWMHLTALVCFYGLVASSFSMVFLGGAGHHIGELQPKHIIRLSKVSNSLISVNELRYGHLRDVPVMQFATANHDTHHS